MQIKLFIYKLERLMKEKYPQIKIDFYCSRRKKNIHIGLDRALFSFSEYSSIIKDFERVCKTAIKSFCQMEVRLHYL